MLDDQARVVSTAVEAPAAAPPARRRPVVATLRFLTKALLPVAILFGAWQGFAFMKATKSEPARRPPSEQVFAVEGRSVAFARYQPRLDLYGETVAGRSIEIRTLVAGEVVEVGPGLREGGEVAAGDTLMVVDSFDYEGALVEAKAQLQEARARLVEFKASLTQEQESLRRDREQLTLAERDLARAVPLASRGTVTQKTVDDRRGVVTQRAQAVEQRQASLTVWSAKIEQQEAALARLEWGVRRAERRLEETRLKAPFDAYVSDVGAEVGRVLGINDRVATLRDRNQLEVRLTLSDGQYGRIIAESGTVVGREATVRWRVGDEPIVYPGRIERTGATISSASGGVPVFIRLADPLQPIPLRAGAFVEVDIADRGYDRVARVPTTAIYGDLVYIIADDRLQPRRIEIIGRDGADALVRGEIESGDVVMTTRISTPGPGVKVQLRDTRRLTTAAQPS